MTASSVPVSSRGRTLALALGAVVAAALATTAAALAAVAFGADPAFGPLQPPVYLSFAVLGTLAAIGGWLIVVRRVRNSARVLGILVPVLLMLSLVPDVVLLVTGFIPGTTVAGVVGLMVMHPIVATVAVVAGRMIAPPR